MHECRPAFIPAPLITDYALSFPCVPRAPPCSMSNAKANKRGHSAHMQAAAREGLRGSMELPIKLTFLGAGSFFTPRLINDVLRIPGERGGVIALVDIDAKRLKLSQRLIATLLARLRKKAWKLIASTDRAAVLPGSDYVVNCIEVSGAECVVHDNDIPARYGIDQCIGDTIGPGGLFKALRTIPVWLDVLRDCERLCPNAIVLNYTNPMGVMCLGAERTSRQSVVGL